MIEDKRISLALLVVVLLIIAGQTHVLDAGAVAQMLGTILLWLVSLVTRWGSNNTGSGPEVKP
jgi:hypothetical protein